MAALFAAGCGKKGDPMIPVTPLPLPVEFVMATLEGDAITVSWRLPLKYNTGDPFGLKDIDLMTVSRKIETPADNRWEFSQTSQGWTVAGKSFPVKLHQGVLRTASQQKNLFLVSPKGLPLKAEETRYIRLKLWAKNSARGYLAFTTKLDAKWDIDRDLTFYPAVYTSFETYRNAFELVKLKAFAIPPAQAENQADAAFEYLIDMKDVPAWQGEIDQIGVVLQNNDPENALVELGLDSFEPMGTLEPQASLYESPAWVFRDDAEGWQANAAATVFGAAGGVLYAQGTVPILLSSAPGQNLDAARIRQIRLSMQATAGDRAYLVLRRPQDKQFPALPRDAAEFSALTVLPFSLNDQADFQTYTIDVASMLKKAEPAAAEPTDKGDSPEKTTPAAAEQKELISQVALFFPAVSAQADRRILIDYVHVADAPVEPETLLPMLVQQDLPVIDEIEQQIRQTRRAQDPDYATPYEELPSQPEQDPTKPIKLAEISPKKPAPAVLEDGRFFLTDTGEFAVADAKEADAKEATVKVDPALRYDERYTYTIEILDRRQQKSAQAGTITVAMARTPTAPYYLQAEPDDGKIHLTWGRPFITADGKKIKTLGGYNIFRSLEAGQYPKKPLAQVSAAETTFTDSGLENDTTYYYTVQAVAQTTENAVVGNFSPEASATPVKKIVALKPPTGLVGVYNGAVANLFWNGAAAQNFAGFQIYRSETRTGEFQQLNPQPILQASYQDATVTAQKTYYYYVTASDQETPPNESRPSEMAVIETITVE